MKCFENNLKMIIATAASQTNKTAADFCGALLEYAAIVRGIAKEYQGQATIEIIRLEHPELETLLSKAYLLFIIKKRPLS